MILLQTQNFATDAYLIHKPHRWLKNAEKCSRLLRITKAIPTNKTALDSNDLNLSGMLITTVDSFSLFTISIDSYMIFVSK